jgi:tetratricopeptide (TPR) repeat protein
LGVVLQAQGAWDDLESLAQHGLKLHETISDSALIARHYGFLADVALHRQQWHTAQEAAQKALNLIESVPEIQQRHRGFYLWLLARSIYPQGQPEVAIAHLEAAKKLGVRDTPQVYIGILETLRSIYFEQKQYLEAFRVKQERRSIQQQYGLRAFVGASRLKPSPSLPSELTESKSTADVTGEIEAFGRQTAINELVSRIASPQHKLTVIYGQSGVWMSLTITSSTKIFSTTLAI